MSSAKYPTRQLGRNGPQVSAIGFGAMDIYGTSEVTIGKWFAQTGRRSDIFLATKFGGCDLTPGAENPLKPNSKPSYIRTRLENSLKNLQTEWIDLYYQHRVDPEVPIEVMEYSLFELEIETTGFVTASRELGASVVAYSHLEEVRVITGRFKLRSDFDPDDFRYYLPRFSDEDFLALVDKFQSVARKYNATPGQIALAWILTTHTDFVPIPGTETADRLEENAKAAEIQLADEDVRELRAAMTLPMFREYGMRRSTWLT
ncbi:Aldo/keto reductase [Wolfiporia cocos MD-104 SS10]|uniref:Aldo/keto reductase n=1 Tax=Wolfiporia cocos (strain MD-104) TaxID=742152 RepID=A0A2H3JCS8_WOLCO|nr:Aldo/keto reductase [Wolfiporia cocos MD-104 SS10]